MNVTFFGHRNAPESIRFSLEKVIEEILKNQEETMFYVGNNGNFDAIVLSVLRNMKERYDDFNYTVVLAYMPTGNDAYSISETVLPEEVAAAFPKYAISKRNMWMIDMSDTVITYVRHSFGGASKFKDIAISRKKRVIELCDI